MTVSIIIPVYNEEGTIGKLLNHLNSCLADKNKTEILIVDGGSSVPP
jgi:glycosyltransferase involved in cell wall biosynthesis